MKIILNKILESKRAIIIIIFVCIFIFTTGIKPLLAADSLPAQGADIALGSVGTAISIVLGLIAFIVTSVVGLLITLLVSILLQVAQYNEFISAPIVTQGWIIIRDLCNMLFILVLLVIAFTTILRMDGYNWKKMLPKLLIMAVLINFSRTIFGLIIDFSQVVMLTFVNAFANGGGWFIKAFNTNLLLSIRTDGASGDFAISAWSTAVAIIAGVIAAIITLIVVAVMLAVLVMRIIMIWIYTIFSPLVFLGFAVPAVQKYTGRIWEDFIKQVIIGPVLAFFLWLALTAASTSSEAIYNPNNVKAAEVCAGVGAFFCTSSLMQFIIVIGILMGGLMVAQQMGGAAGAWGMNLARRTATAPIRTGRRAIRGAADTGLTYLSQGENPNPATGEAGSRRGRLRERLGALGATNIPGVNTLATNALTGLGARQRAFEEEAQRYVAGIRDTRILGRMANQSNLMSVTPWQAAIRDAARHKSPSQIADAGQRNQTLGRLNQVRMQGLSGNEWERLGSMHQRGEIDLFAHADVVDYLQSNRSAREHVNRGGARVGGIMDIQGTNFGGITRNGHFLGRNNRGIAYTPANAPIGATGDETARARGIYLPTQNNQVPGPLNPLAYRRTGDAQRAGSGSLSVNRFGRGKDNTIGVDLNTLGLEFLKGQDLGSINGINAMDKGQIAEIAKKMVGVLDQEIHKLESNSRTKGEEKRLANMRSARERLQDPNKIDNISLVNTGSNEHGSLSEMGRTKIHEEVHGFGVRDEDKTEAISQEIERTRQYSKRKEKALKEIVDTEEKEEKELVYEGDGNEIKNIVNSISNSFNSSGTMKDLVYYMKQLGKNITGNTNALGRFNKNILDNANLNKMSPLEIKVIADKIKKSVK